jgi:adenosylcobinamide kinase/adenosylcobinamide-phosphate guanylyltransferase
LILLSLILGGVRSGKSRYAEQCVKQSGSAKVYYIATAQAADEEMQQRIAIHQQQRPLHWQTIEAPVKLAETLQQYAQQGNCLLVDCLTLWLSNIMFDAQGNIQETVLQQQVMALLTTLPKLSADIILVSNEIGSGGIALDKLTRQFVDETGRLHQKLAAICDRVVLVTAGLPQVLKT